MRRLALRSPGALGRKLMSTLHDAAGARVLGAQPVVARACVASEKSAALGPVRVIEVMMSGCAPVFVSFSVCLSCPPLTIRAPKFSVETSNPIPGPAIDAVVVGSVPVPLRAMTFGDEAELLARLSAAVLAPVEVGWKRVPMTQLAPGATALVQPLEAIAN